METQTTNTDWLKAEEEQLALNKPLEFEQLPSLKLVKDAITEFIVDFSKPFEKWNDEVNNTLKAIIPVTHENTKKNFWLNVKNPLYKEIVSAGRNGINHFKVLQTGTAKQTKYTIIK